MNHKQQQIMSICQALFEDYGYDFKRWVEEQIVFDGLKLDSLTWQQIEIAQELIDKKRVCVAAGGGIGKSAVAALLVIWFLGCHPYARIPTTAPNRQLLKDVLWAEIGKWIKRCRHASIYDLKTEKMYIKGFREWYAVARTVPKESDKINDTMAGFHAPWMLSIVDEASGVPDGVYTALEGAMTEENAFILLISNPVSTGGYYYDTINDTEGKGSQFKVLFYSSIESPLVDASFAESIIVRYGIDSPMYRSKVLGLPINELDTVIVAPSAFDRVTQNNREHYDGPVTIAIDVGGDSGKDPSIFSFRKGMSIFLWEEFLGKDEVFLYNECLAMRNRFPQVRFIVDANGIGAGLYSQLANTAGVEVYGFIGSKRPEDELAVDDTKATIDKQIQQMYLNNRTRGYHRLQRIFPSLHFPVSPPTRLKKELANLMLVFNSGKPIEMEPKIKFKKRLGFSPDYADSLMMSVFLDVVSGKIAYNAPPHKALKIFSRLAKPSAFVDRSKFHRFG